MNLKVWNVGGKAFIDIDDAVETVVGLVGDRALAIYKTNRDNWDEMICKEAQEALKHMEDGDVLDFMGVRITIGNMSFDF